MPRPNFLMGFTIKLTIIFDKGSSHSYSLQKSVCDKISSLFVGNSQANGIGGRGIQ